MALNLPWKKISSIYTCCGSIVAGAYIYFLIPKGEPQSVGEVLDRAGFIGVEKASAADLKKIVAAYKLALASKDFQKMEGVEITDESTDEEVVEQIKGGCRRLSIGKTTSVNKENGRRFCIVPTTISETLKKRGISFLDMKGHTHDDIWAQKADLLISSGKAGKNMTADTPRDSKIKLIKSSCSDLAGAPTTSGKFGSFLDVATTYCTDKRGDK
ncbi:hypothetical protein A6V39_03325 [Candidatus Mycoplasma haematobovis]|uniref:Uncharacterized protein n=1 Tax=Candidatus Mycoplasma haematobovis TaxID=432608 RepID=A0A1A9QD74_9MOLU|nr:hypothetical protein [Candidatus Mycoplasma haematobovis]OAL09916.1 hypothetical protein A6V39_03325 [Candidatus Mycoplasma haematobovis]